MVMRKTSGDVSEIRERVHMGEGKKLFFKIFHKDKFRNEWGLLKSGS